MKLSLAARLPLIAAAALTVMAVDWGLKAWALAALRPDQIVFNADSTWQQVTDFLPLGVPYTGTMWSPADIFLIGGLVLLWYGAFRYGRARSLNADALQARDPVHGHRRRTRREGHALP